MFKNYKFLLLSLLFSYSVSSQITVTNTLTPADLVNNILLGNGVAATNIKYNGSLVNAGVVKQNCTYFNSGSTTFPLTDGVLLTTGAGSMAVGPNNSTGSTLQGTTVNVIDADLSSIASPTTIKNGVTIEFDFIATSDSISFQYILAVRRTKVDKYICIIIHKYCIILRV